MGLRADPGKPADRVAIATARYFGIHLESHRATRFDPELIYDFDLVVGFETWHVEQLECELLGRNLQIRLAGAFIGNLALHMHDPYGLNDDYFRRCFEKICTAVEGMRRDIFWAEEQRS